MENKNVGYILLGISVIIIFIIFMFKSALTGFVASSCTLAHGGNSCPMYYTINKQTNLSLSIVGILIFVGLSLVFSKPEKEVIIKTKTISPRPIKHSYDLSELRREDKEVFNLIKDNKTIFQGEIIEKTSFGKAKVSRIIDRLENKGFVERKRRGLTNVVVLKD